jgi:hydroxymethylpyrimidine/phosphomethylpyrimidine kinase
MVAESGAHLLECDARRALIDVMLPLATVVTPNLPEARALTGAGEDVDARDLAPAIRALGPRIVVITGGHRDEATDVYFDGRQVVELPGERYPDGAAHGSGCTHSSVLAACLALGHAPLEAARQAKRRAALAVAGGLREIGAGPGPVDVLGIKAR